MPAGYYHARAMAEVLYYAIPFFVLLLVLEYLSFRHVRDEDEDLVGYEARDTRTSLTMGFGNVVINFGWKFAVLAAYVGDLRADAAAARSRRLVGLGAALLRRRLLLLLVPPRSRTRAAASGRATSSTTRASTTTSRPPCGRPGCR